MIVKMKKVSLVVLESLRTGALEKLRELGVIHIEREYKASDTVNALMEKKALYEKSFLALQAAAVKAESEKTEPASFHADAEETAEKTASILEKTRQLEDRTEKSWKDITLLEPWGDFNPSDIELLGEKGIFIQCYELSKEQFSRLPDDVEYFSVNKIKDKNFIAVISTESIEKCDIPGAERSLLPAKSISELNNEIQNNISEIKKLEKELKILAAHKEVLEEGLKNLEEKIEFEAVNADMGTEEIFAYISGYVPVDLADNLKAEAAAMNWALLIRDPSEEEKPPTLVRNPKWVSIIQPLFRFLDTTPGYRELDISMVFLMFFSVFVAMIVGDAGYGIIFLALTITARIMVKKAPREIFTLMTVLSLSTIIWGVITGTWFGSETLSEIPVLKSMIVPSIASFGPADTSGMIMQISFLIGLTHLTIGILINFSRKMPSLAAVAELGWLLILYSMYFFARFFVLGAELNQAAVILFAAGFALVIIFSGQDGKFIKGVLSGLAWSPMKFLDSVSMFADLVSYIRLFAVGLATVAVAQSFNTMAAGFEGVTGMILAAVLLFFAHTFNMGMALLSIVVHGVRLNMLEFGGKLEMEWSGYVFSPFKKREL